MYQRGKISCFEYQEKPNEIYYQLSIKLAMDTVSKNEKTTNKLDRNPIKMVPKSLSKYVGL